MKNILVNILNWYRGLSVTKKVIWGLGGTFFILPLIFGLLLTILMLLLMFIPFIAIIVAIVLLVFSFFRKKNAREYRISSLICIVIAFVSVFIINSFMDWDGETNGDTNKDAVVLESSSDNSSKSDSISSIPQVEDKQYEVEKVVAPIVNEGKIHFINTGNSDAILIENDGKFAMIDTGNTDDDATVKAYLQKKGVQKLDCLILTHFHADHIGSADTVINDFDVETTLVPNGDATTQVYKDYINALSNKGLQPSVPLEGSKFELGSATLTIYNTQGGSSNENNDSLVVLYENGEDRALFMGDAESEVEKKLIIGDVDLLKVGHHGSNTSSTETFINDIQPEYAVILVGQPNQYGHPSKEVLNLFETKGIPVYRTDEQGDIVFVSTGKGLKTESEAGSYVAGELEEDKSNTPQTQSGSSSEESSSSNSSNNSSSSQSGASNSSNNSSSSQSGSSSSSNNSSSSQSGSSNSSGSSSSSTSSKDTTNYKDDNPNGVYNQEPTPQKESYKNCTLLKAVYPDGVPEGHPAYESKHDRDKDGWACE